MQACSTQASWHTVVAISLRHVKLQQTRLGRGRGFRDAGPAPAFTGPRTAAAAAASSARLPSASEPCPTAEASPRLPPDIRKTKPTPTMQFLDLPTELIHQIAEKLDEFGIKDLIEACPSLTALIPLLETAFLGTQKNRDRKISALHWAAEKGYKRLAEILLDSGTEINVRDYFNQTPLHHAVLVDNAEMARFFLARDGVNVNAYDHVWQTAFHCAALSGRESMVQLFLDRGCDIDQGTFHADQTALQFAVQFGNTAVAELLLREGADIERRCERGKTALHWAAQGNGVFNSELVPGLRLLLERGAGVNVQDYWGNTPLHLLAQCHLDGACDAIKLLLDRGAGIDVQNKKGRTALHVAALDEAERDSPEVLNLLLDEGADIAVRDSRGVTALEIAISRGFRFGRRKKV